MRSPVCLIGQLWKGKYTARRMILVVMLAAATIATIVAIWDTIGGGAASRKLLSPVIKYHESQYEINRVHWQHDLDRAKEAMGHTNSTFDRLTRLSDNASELSKNVQPIRDDASREVDFAKRRLVGDISRVGERLRDASTYQSMTSYHLHMKFYYEGLLNDRVARLPQLPEALEVERKMIELDLQRRYGHLWEQDEERMLLHQYESEPPPHLAPSEGPGRPGKLPSQGSHRSVRAS